MMASASSVRSLLLRRLSIGRVFIRAVGKWHVRAAVLGVVLSLVACTATERPTPENEQLSSAALAGDLALAQRLVADGADIDAADSTGRNPYLIVTASGDVEFLRWLLDEGADPLATDDQGGTGLIHAADAGNVEVVRILLTTAERDYIDRVNTFGWTALLEAILLGDGDADHTRIVAMLLDAGADPNIADSGGISPLQHAQDRGYTAIADALIAAGGTIDS